MAPTVTGLNELISRDGTSVLGDINQVHHAKHVPICQESPSCSMAAPKLAVGVGDGRALRSGGVRPISAGIQVEDGNVRAVLKDKPLQAVGRVQVDGSGGQLHTVEPGGGDGLQGLRERPCGISVAERDALTTQAREDLFFPHRGVGGRPSSLLGAASFLARVPGRIRQGAPPAATPPHPVAPTTIAATEGELHHIAKAKRLSAAPAGAAVQFRPRPVRRTSHARVRRDHRCRSTRSATR